MTCGRGSGVLTRRRAFSSHGDNGDSLEQEDNTNNNKFARVAEDWPFPAERALPHEYLISFAPGRCLRKCECWLCGAGLRNVQICVKVVGSQQMIYPKYFG